MHCSTEELEKSDLTFPVFFRNVEYKVFVRRRPHLEQFLSSMSGLFEIIVFTASHRVYADKLLDILDPENRYFTHRVFRDSCVFHVGNYVKDLSVLGRDLSRTVIIDNSPQAFGFHIDNGRPPIGRGARLGPAGTDADVVGTLALRGGLLFSPR